MKLDQHGELKWQHAYYPNNNLNYVWNGEDTEIANDGGLKILELKAGN